MINGVDSTKNGGFRGSDSEEVFEHRVWAHMVDLVCVPLPLVLKGDIYKGRLV